jgi:hypothetical protein
VTRIHPSFKENNYTPTTKIKMIFDLREESDSMRVLAESQQQGHL